MESGLVSDEHIDPDARGILPGVPHEPLNQASPDSPPSVFGLHEDLAQVDVVRVASKERISDDCAALLDDRCFVFASQPFGHSLDELRNGHRVAVPLVADEQGIERAQSFSVLDLRKPKFHDALTVKLSAPSSELETCLGQRLGWVAGSEFCELDMAPGPAAI